MKKLVVVCLVICFGALPLAASAAGPVNVASKGFTEQEGYSPRTWG